MASGCQTLSSISTARCGSQYVNHGRDCDSEVIATTEHMHSQHDQQLKRRALTSLTQPKGEVTQMFRHRQWINKIFLYKKWTHTQDYISLTKEILTNLQDGWTIKTLYKENKSVIKWQIRKIPWLTNQLPEEVYLETQSWVVLPRGWGQHWVITLKDLI